MTNFPRSDQYRDGELHFAPGAAGEEGLSCWLSRTESGHLRIGAQEYALSGLEGSALARLEEMREDGLVEIDPELGSVKLAGW